MAMHITEVVSEPWAVFMMIALLLLLIGFILSLEACVVLVTPVLVPMASVMGIDLIHLGVFMVVILAIGQLTPPVAITLLAAAKIGAVPPQVAFVHAMPFVFILFVVGLLIGVFPETVLWFPNYIFGS